MQDAPYAEIPLLAKDGSIRAYARVDAADSQEIAAYRWHRNSNGYALRSCWPDVVLMHRQLLGLSSGDGVECDHRNRDKLDNRRANIRRVTHSQNMQNQSAQRDSSSPFRAVHWDAGRHRWRARIAVEKRYYSLGRFVDDFEAALAVERFRREHMPFAEPDPELLRRLQLSPA